MQWISFQTCPVFGCESRNIVAVGWAIPASVDWFVYDCPHCGNHLAFQVGVVAQGIKSADIIQGHRYKARVHALGRV